MNENDLESQQVKSLVKYLSMLWDDTGYDPEAALMTVHTVGQKELVTE